MLHPSARMGITDMHRTLARLTVTTGRIGSMAECLLELDLGLAALEEVTGGVVDFTDAVASADVALVDADLTGEAALDVAASTVDEAAGLRADRSVVGSTVVAVGTSAEQVAADSTAVEARSTAVVAVDSTAVEEAMVAGTGN
jgi:hypothetical protein